jgi:hypothetical protein
MRGMLHQAGLPKTLWGEATQYTVWLKNCTSTRALGNTMPYERLYGAEAEFIRPPRVGTEHLGAQPKRIKVGCTSQTGVLDWFWCL